MNYVTQRLLTFPLILLGVSVLVFVAIRLVPGDAIIAMLGTEAGLLTQAQRAALAAYFGLDQPSSTAAGSSACCRAISASPSPTASRCSMSSSSASR
jgi:ABC-type dipeptide/oligopeptide/nickel transport system permease component